MLQKSPSRKSCVTCHFFLQHPGTNCIPLLTCHLHQGLIAQGKNLTNLCSGRKEDLRLKRGWAPAEVEVSGRASNRPPLWPKEAWLSDGRQMSSTWMNRSSSG